MTDASENPREFEFTNSPNLLTLGRILIIPLIIYALFQESEIWKWIAVTAFALAGITDYFDGYLARRQNLVTVYGKLMDPLADKFLVVASLVMLQELDRIHPVVVILLICREIGITGLRALASAEGVVISASQGGKWKTFVQMFALPFLMVDVKFFGLVTSYQIGYVLLYSSLAMSMWSAKDYAVDFFKKFAETRRLRRRERQNEKT